MAASNFIFFQANLDDVRIADLIGSTIKLSLHTSAYIPNVDTSGHSIASNLTNELPTGGGYTTGGILLTSPTKTAITGGYKFSTANAQWTATGSGIPAWRYAVLRVEGTIAGKVNPIIGYILGDTTPADVPTTTDGNTLTVSCPINGWFNKKVSV